MNVSDARKLRALEDENNKLKRMLADAMLDNAALKDFATKKGLLQGAIAIKREHCVVNTIIKPSTRWGVSMRIIRSYGQSVVKNSKRKIQPKSPGSNPKEIREHLDSDALVIAQWISAIDKIARKPSGNNGATEQQRELRKKLGGAAWSLMQEKSLLSCSAEDREKLKKTWKWKLHPYGCKVWKPDRKQTNPPEAKGRWYERFAGDTSPDNIDQHKAAIIADKIHVDLYKSQFSFTDKQPVEKPQGRIALRASSIEKNVLVRQMEKRNDKPAWDDNDKKAYADAGDVAACIYARITEIKGSERKSRLYVACAAQPLHDHYGKLFQGEHKNVLHVSTQHPGLFALHQAVKDSCKSLFGGRRKLETLKNTFPKTTNGLLELVQSRQGNKDINALIRLGRIIHYQAMHDAHNKPGKNRPLAPVTTYWPADIACSRYWGSDGQAEIKRNEAFVRVWRNTLSMASRTLTDWVDPEGRLKDDILLNVDKKNVNPQAFRKKLPLLFGKRSRLFDTDKELSRAVLQAALQGLAGLRNAAFHFKGIDNFTHALENSLKRNSIAANAIANLWEGDEGDNAERLLEDMKAAHFAHYFNHEQNKKFFKAVLNTDLPFLPLPRFRRMLARADNAWEGKDSLLLPPPANQQELENPARNCQYQALKLLYEKVFPDWLAKQSAEKMNEHIKKAEGRATTIAKAMNGDLAVWKAAGRFGLQQGESIADFLSRISAETASEMRVQRGYESDPEKARKQSKYLEDIRCDLIARAFTEWLQKEKFQYLLYDSPQDGEKKALYWKLGAQYQGKEKDHAFDRNHPAPKPPDEDWPKTLYFLLHLVPVDEIARLRHQLDKWALLEGKDKGESIDSRSVHERKKLLRRTLILYQDMHDAKFEGGDALPVPPKLKNLYEPGTFNEVFARVSPDAAHTDRLGYDLRIPRRGLREMLRFGSLNCLMPMLEPHKVSKDDVKRLRSMEEGTDSAIATAQATRTRLHEEWVEGKNRDKNQKFTASDLESYKEALGEITSHRQLSAQVYLKNHVRLHQLLMGVLGRLVDYAGLWERDRYFATLGLIYREGLNLNKDFGKTFKERFKEGGTKYYDAVDAWPQDKPNVLVPMLERYFGGHLKDNDIVKIRDRLAHFDALLPKRNNDLNLTVEINRARQMLSHDRKLKNAVSKSIIELLYREGLELSWKCPSHHLSGARLQSRKIKHLGKNTIKEELHDKDYVAMVAHLFGGTVETRPGREGTKSQSGRKTQRHRRNSR